MASKNFPTIDSIRFHGSKLVPENDRAKSKINFLLPFPYEDKILPTQAVVSATTTTTTIDSTNNTNTNNSTASDTKSILIPSSTTTTAANNRADNKNKHSNVVNDSDNSWHKNMYQQLQQITLQIAWMQIIQRTISAANRYHQVLMKKGINLRNVTMLKIKI